MRTAALALAAACLACASGPGSPQGRTGTPSPQRAPAGDTAQKNTPGPGGVSLPNADPFPSTYRPFPSRPTVIRNVTILSAAGPRIANGALLMRDGKIAAVGASVDAPAGAAVIDGAGKYVTPGIIEVHSH